MLSNLKYYFLGTFFLIFLSLIVAGCTNSGPQFDKMEWLSGRWENENNGMRMIETWKRENGKGFLVNGYTMEGADTVFSEIINVTSKQGSIIYTVTISEQNNGEPVTFKLTENTGNKVVFENPEHDFPRKIIYQKHKADSIQVQIEGMVNRKPNKQKYYLKRTRN